MDFEKFQLYINIIAICLNASFTYILFISVITHQSIDPTLILALAFGYSVMLTRNKTFKELCVKWFKK